jgi:integrase
MWAHPTPAGTGEEQTTMGKITEEPTGEAGIRRRLKDGVPLGKPYTVRYRPHPSADPKRRSFHTIKEARRFYADTRASVLTGTFIDPVERLQTVSEYADRWVKTKRWSKATRDRRESIIRRHIKPTFGEDLLGNVDWEAVQTWVIDMEDKYTAKTIKLHLDVLASMFNDAVFAGKLAKSPVERIARPEITHQVSAVLHDADVAAIAEGMDDSCELMVWLGAMAGLRIGEVLGLTPGRIDFAKGTIKVNGQLTPAGEFRQTKTKASVRTIPVHADLIARIKTHIDTHGLSDKGTLFSHEGAALRHLRVYRTLWPQAVKGLELDEGCDTFHALRHHYASVLIAGGCNAKEVQVRLGHQNIKITYDTYVHLFEAADESTRKAFDGRYATSLRVVA